MDALRRTRFVSLFDREPFIASTLRWGMFISMGCLAAGLAWQRLTTGDWELVDTLQGTNVLALLMADVQQARSLAHPPQLLCHLGIAVLLLVPYVRTLASCWYFASVERNVRYTLYTTCLALLMTYILLLG